MDTKDIKAKIIAVDFDGTLCVNQYPGMGLARAAVIKALLAEQNNGAKLILWTCREGIVLDNALEWCKDRGLIFDAVNDNLDFVKESIGGNPRKVIATEYWDDRNFNIDLV